MENKMKTPQQQFFEGLAKTQKIPVGLAHKIIDGRYKPYLSALDDQYYGDVRSSVYDAKYYALSAALDKFGREKTIEKLKEIKR
jgi:hypothetical protein